MNSINRGTVTELVTSLFEGGGHFFRRDDKKQIIEKYNSICTSIKSALRDRGIDIVLPQHRSVKEMQKYVLDTLQNDKISNLERLEKVAQEITIDKMRNICDAIVQGEDVWNGKSGYKIVSDWVFDKIPNRFKKPSVIQVPTVVIETESVENRAQKERDLADAAASLTAVLPAHLSLEMLLMSISEAESVAKMRGDVMDVKAYIAMRLPAPISLSEEDDWEEQAEALDVAEAVAPNIDTIMPLYVAYITAKRALF